MPPDPVDDSTQDPKPVTATLQVVLVMLALLLVIGLAGVPGLQPSAGNGSLSLRHGWAQQQAAGQQAAGQQPTAQQDSGAAPAGAGDASPDGEEHADGEGH